MVGNSREGMKQMLSAERREQKKQQMLEKSFELFVKQGLENTSLNELTTYCDTYKAAFYNYFKSKDEIVIECAKMYMTKLDEMFKNEFSAPQSTLEKALKQGFKIVTQQKNELRFIYQVVSSPKYGETCRKSLSSIYETYLNYSEVFSKIYKVEHLYLRPIYLLYVATIHDFCLWENEDLVTEKLEYIYKSISELDNNK